MIRATKRFLLIAAAIAPCLLSSSVFAQNPAAGYHWPDEPWHSHELTPNIHWIDGGGGNVVVFEGKDSLTLYDAKTTLGSGKEVQTWIRKISSKPVKTIIISHSDVDHSGGLRAFPTRDITVIAQQHAAEELKKDLQVDPKNALPAEFFPNRTVGDKTDLDVDGFKMELLHFGPAHTSGDLVLYLPEQKIMFMGDIITQNRQHQLVHPEKNGSVLGWINFTRDMLKYPAVTFIPGHGDPMNRAQVQMVLDNAEAEVAEIRQLAAQGKSLKEIEVAVHDPTPEELHGPPFPPFAEVAYGEVTNGKH